VVSKADFSICIASVNAISQLWNSHHHLATPPHSNLPCHKKLFPADRYESNADRYQSTASVISQIYLLKNVKFVCLTGNVRTAFRAVRSSNEESIELLLRSQFSNGKSFYDTLTEYYSALPDAADFPPIEAVQVCATHQLTLTTFGSVCN
jgi:hypothetical protein